MPQGPDTEPMGSGGMPPAAVRWLVGWLVR